MFSMDWNIILDNEPHIFMYATTINTNRIPLVCRQIFQILD